MIYKYNDYISYNNGCNIAHLLLENASENRIKKMSDSDNGKYRQLRWDADYTSTELLKQSIDNKTKLIELKDKFKNEFVKQLKRVIDAGYINKDNYKTQIDNSTDNPIHHVMSAVYRSRNEDKDQDYKRYISDLDLIDDAGKFPEKIKDMDFINKDFKISDEKRKEVLAKDPELNLNLLEKGQELTGRGGILKVFRFAMFNQCYKNKINIINSSILMDTQKFKKHYDANTLYQITGTELKIISQGFTTSKNDQPLKVVDDNVVINMGFVDGFFDTISLFRDFDSELAAKSAKQFFVDEDLVESAMLASEGYNNYLKNKEAEDTKPKEKSKGFIAAAKTFFGLTENNNINN